MNDTTSVVEGQVSQPMTVRDALRRRLEYNTPVLHQLPEVRHACMPNLSSVLRY